MKKYGDRFVNTPLRLLETVVAVGSLVSALYFLTPLYAIGRAIQPSPLTTVLINPVWVLFLGAVLAVVAVLVLIGLYKNSVGMRSAGFFIMALVRIYQMFAILIVAGPLPLQWLTPLILALICLVLRATVRRGKSTWLST